MKQIVLLLALGLASCKAQTAKTETATGLPVKIKGTTKNKLIGLVYFEALNERGIATKLDSVTIKDGGFALDLTIKEPGFYQLNAANSQRAILVLDGGEDINVTLEGVDLPEKKGSVLIQGSKPLETFYEINQITANMQAKVAEWQAEYQAASQKKNQNKMREVEARFETAQQQLVEQIKVKMPNLGTSLVALWATNFMNIDTDFDIYDGLATQLEAQGKTYPIAKQFISMVKKKKGTAMGGDAPNFTLTSHDGKTVKLSDLKGSMVILDFWATWCGPCIASFPGMKAAMEKYKDRTDVKFFFVDTFERVDPAAVKDHVGKFLTSRGDLMKNMTILMDNGQVATDYSVNGIPAKFFIGKDGKVLKKSEGFLGSSEAIVAEIDEWIKEGSK